jgi:hypothetical protein
MNIKQGADPGILGFPRSDGGKPGKTSFVPLILDVNRTRGLDNSLRQ